ncbi:MAG: hypothetical protein PHU64_07440 [Candidatus Omnitrophica bacterium]|nr:hypothetical protein [Candidatus Omnitrophota bacterium]MDD5429977.1 hypothetical protein [Candidatus Omnitrophota bacterium]
MSKKNVIIGCGIGLLIAIVFLIPGRKSMHIESREQGVATKKSSEKEQSKPLPLRRQLKRSYPEDYGMTTYTRQDEPKTQKQWDRFISKGIERARSNLSSTQWDGIKEKLKEDPEKTKEKLKQIDEKIIQCQQELKKDPGNDILKKRIQRLRMLKAIAKKFER